MLWNREVLTDRGVTANKPEIIIKNKNEETCILIDVAIPTDRHIMKKEAEKKRTKMQESMYRNATNVEYEMCDDTSKHWEKHE